MLRIDKTLNAVILILAFMPTQSISAAEKSTYEFVLAGKKCKTWNQTISCEYSVGMGLQFSIDGIGQPDTGITYMKSSFEGDFYATYGLRHGCIIIKRGPKGVKSSDVRGPGSFTDYAFVSPKNGKVYLSWEECQKAF